MGKEERLLTIRDRSGTRVCVLDALVAIRYDEQHGTNVSSGVIDGDYEEARRVMAAVAAWLILGGDDPGRVPSG